MDQATGVDPAIEAEAREMGWTPQAEWKGKEGDWKSADEYVSYGKSVLPIMNATNKRLKEQVAAMARDQAQLKALIATSQQAIEDLNKFHDADTKRQVEEVKARLAEELKAARESGDTKAEIDILAESGRLAAAEGEEKKRPDAPVTRPTAPVETAAESAWRVDNVWYGTDMKKSRRALLIGHEIAEDLPHLTGADPAFYRELDKRLKIEFGGTTERPGDSKVEGSGGAGSGHSGGSRGGSRSFESLPSDARAAAKSFERELVGPNRQHKTLKDFQTSWAAEYYRQEDKRSNA